MIDNDSQELHRPGGADDSVLWFFDHLTWSHLDEIPDEVLDALLNDFQKSGEACAIVITGKVCPDIEDPMVFKHTIQNTAIDIGVREPFQVFRSWIYVERARRLGFINQEIPDVLVRDLPFNRTPISSFTFADWTDIRARVNKALGIRRENQ